MSAVERRSVRMRLLITVECNERHLDPTEMHAGNRLWCDFYELTSLPLSAGPDEWRYDSDDR